MADGHLNKWPSSSIAWPSPAAAPTAAVGGFTYQSDGPWRAVWRLPGGTGAYQNLLGLCQDPQECWLFWLCSPLVPPPLQGTVLYEHSQSACGPVGKVVCSEKDRNKPAKCWISFSCAGKGSRDSRRSCSSDSRTWVPCEGKEGGEGSLAESTQPTQECLQKQLRICLLEQWMLLVLGSCLHSREGLAPSTRTREGPTSLAEESLIGARGASYPSILSPREVLDKTV